MLLTPYLIRKIDLNLRVFLFCFFLLINGSFEVRYEFMRYFLDVFR